MEREGGVEMPRVRAPVCMLSVLGIISRTMGIITNCTQCCLRHGMSSFESGGIAGLCAGEAGA